MSEQNGRPRYPQANIRLTGIEDGIRSRGAVPASVVRSLVERYLWLVDRELRSVQLDAGEALLLADASNGTLWLPEMVPHLDSEIEDAITLDHLDRRYGVDGPALVAKLRALTSGQKLAIVDALERAWAMVGDEPMDARLRAVGLVRD